MKAIGLHLCLLAASASAFTSVACSKDSAPAAPSGGASACVTTITDGSTLKATAPTLQSPANGAKLPQFQPVVLVAGNSTTPCATGVPLSYRFEVSTTTGGVVESALVGAGGAAASRTVAALLNSQQTYQWRARAEYLAYFGPWSGYQTFVAPANDGYIKATELFDPLTNGKTVGTIGGSGNVTFVPNQGLRMNDPLAYVIYQMPQTFSSGEMSVEVTGLAPDGEPGKARIISMLDRPSSLASSSKYSFNLQYRGAGGAPNNCITWKAVLGDNAHSVEPPNRFNNIFTLDPSTVYLWQGFWTPTSFRVVVRQGGVTGPVVYEEKVDATSGTTNWNPEVMYPFLGTNNGTFVDNDGTRVGMTLKNLWVGNTPRPATLP